MNPGAEISKRNMEMDKEDQNVITEKRDATESERLLYELEETLQAHETLNQKFMVMNNKLMGAIPDPVEKGIEGKSLAVVTFQQRLASCIMRYNRLTGALEKEVRRLEVF